MNVINVKIKQRSEYGKSLFSQKNKDRDVYICREMQTIISKIKRAKFNYSIELTGSTTSIIVPEFGEKGTKYIFSSNFLKKSSLGFINQVKKYALSTEKEIQPFDSKDVGYYKFSHENRDGVFYDVVEVDVNGAYWELAKKFGYIDQKIYKKGLEVDKKTRLIALGALATVKRCFSFVFNELIGDYEEVHLPDKKNPVLRSYFFHVAKQLDIYMNEFFEKYPKKGMYLFWVDAFFVDNHLAPELIKFFASKGLNVKKKEISCITCKTSVRSKKVWCYEVKKRHSDRTDIQIKTFFETDKQVVSKRALRNFRNTIKNFDL